MALSEAVPGAPTSRFQRARNLVRSYEGLIKFVCFACALVSVLTTFGIIWILLTESINFFQKVSIGEFLTGKTWTPNAVDPKFGILPLLTGTLLITVGSALIAVPLGLMASIYLSEYARPEVRNILKPALELLAGVPTVVYGYFALFFVTPALRAIFPSIQPTNAASGAIVVGIMILPLVTSLCEDAISAVPRSLREAAYGLGATKYEVTMKTIVPSALSGISAAFMLALSRAIGETMAVTLAAGASPRLTLNPAESIMTMTAYIVNVSKGDVPVGSVQYNTIFAVGLTLFVMTLFMNIAAHRLVRKFRLVAG